MKNKSPISMRVKLLRCNSTMGLSESTALQISQIIHNIPEAQREAKAEEITELIYKYPEEELVKILKTMM